MECDTPYAICRFDDIPSRRAVGFHLVAIGEDGDAKPWPIIIVRWGRQVFGYVNRCPHNNVNLDWERSQFLDSSGQRLMCGKHGSTFDLATGAGLDGPCKGQSLTPIALAVLDDEICVIGVRLSEDEEVAGED